VKKLAKIHGKNAKIEKKDTKITNTTNWTLSIPGNLEDVTVHSDEWMHRVTGIKDWSGSIDFVVDLDAAQTDVQDLLLQTTPAVATFSFYLNDNSFYSGPGWVESIDLSAPADGLEEGTFNIVGEGTLEANLQ